MTRRSKFLPLLCSLLVSGAASGQDTLKVCVDSQPHPPYFDAERDGTLQLLQKMAAAHAGLGLDFHAMPARRCIEEVRANTSDAMGAAAVNETSLASGVFPRKGEAVDRRRALAVARTVVFRIKNGTAGWNGRQFDNLHTRVLMPAGMGLTAEKLSRLGLGYDDGATDIRQIGEKLLAGRAELAVALEYDVADLLKQEEFAGKLEVLSKPFTETEYYMVFAKEYYAKHREQAENMWNAIAHVRRSPEYAAALRREGLPPLDLPRSN